MNKNLIYQVKVGNCPAFYDTCIGSVATYCQKHGIDHIVQTEPILKIRPLNSHRSHNAVERLGYLPIYEKENAFAHFWQYEKICIVDGDIFIRDTAPNIFDEIGNEAFAGVLEREMPLTPAYFNKIEKYSKAQYGNLPDVDWQWNKHGAAFYNMGLMLMTRNICEYLEGNTPEEFIRRKEFEKFVNGEGQYKWSTDQTMLNYWVKKSGMPVKNLDWKWNTLFKGVHDDVLHQSHFIHFFLSANLPQKGAEIPSIIADLSKATTIKKGHG